MPHQSMVLKNALENTTAVLIYPVKQQSSDQCPKIAGDQIIYES
jgi:hypothetical protein